MLVIDLEVGHHVVQHMGREHYKDLTGWYVYMRHNVQQREDECSLHISWRMLCASKLTKFPPGLQC